MLQQALDGRKGTGCHIGAGLKTVDDVTGVTDGGRKHHGAEAVVVVHLHNLLDESDTVLRDVVQTTYERRHVGSSGLGGKKCLTKGEHKGAVGLDALAGKIFHCLDTCLSAGKLDDNMLVEGCKLLTLAYHALIPSRTMPS